MNWHWRRTAFYLIIFYYWMMLNAAHLYTTRERSVEPGSIQYWMLVLPICAFVGIVGASLLKATLRREVWWLALFAVLVFAAAAVKGDPRVAVSFVLLILTIAVVIEGRLTVSVRFLNVLFLISVAWGAITTFTGVNQYGILPFADSNYLGVGWRVSLFPYAIVGSAFFSLFVLIANIDVTARYRRLAVPLALYFALFSANRTTLVCLLLIGFFLIARRFIPFERRAIYRWLIPVSLVAFFVAIALLPILALRAAANNSVATGLVFHREAEDLAEFQVDRLIIWANHISVFAAHPLLGGRPSDLREVELATTVATGSESFLTRVAAQTGVVVILLILAFRAALRRSFVTRNARAYATLLVLPILTLSYGSFIVPYNLVFLLLLSLLVPVSNPAGYHAATLPDPSHP